MVARDACRESATNGPRYCGAAQYLRCFQRADQEGIHDRGGRRRWQCGRAQGVHGSLYGETGNPPKNAQDATKAYAAEYKTFTTFYPENLPPTVSGVGCYDPVRQWSGNAPLTVKQYSHRPMRWPSDGGGELESQRKIMDRGALRKQRVRGASACVGFFMGVAMRSKIQEYCPSCFVYAVGTLRLCPPWGTRSRSANASGVRVFGAARRATAPCADHPRQRLVRRSVTGVRGDAIGNRAVQARHRR